jgi:predicted TIM-barrel fold metal-dependent hydrolase
VLGLDGGLSDDERRRQLSRRQSVDEVFAELQRRGAVVFIHPTASPDPIAHTLGLPDALLDYPVDTSRAIAKLHYSNTFARTPDVKYVFSHTGGTIPFVASRFAIVDAMDVIPGADERGAFTETVKRLYWDTASAFGDPVLHLLRSLTGLHNVVFGTDYPYPHDRFRSAGCARCFAAIERNEVGVVELDLDRGHVLLQMRDRARAWDQQHPLVAGRQPRQRDLWAPPEYWSTCAG